MTDTLTTRRQDLRDQVWQHGPEHFNMETWYSGPGTSSYFNDIRHGLNGKVDINVCGTTACLAGHGALVMAKNGFELSDAEMDERNDAGERWASAQDVADYFGLSRALFFLTQWHTVRFADGDTLVTKYMKHGGENNGSERCRQAEWSIIIDFLDELIKGGSND